MTDRPEYLASEDVAKLLEAMRSKLAKEFGVTVQADPNGAWGPMGKTYVTLRFAHDWTPEFRDHIEVHMAIDCVSSHQLNRRAEYERNNPQ